MSINNIFKLYFVHVLHEETNPKYITGLATKIRISTSKDSAV